MAKRGLVSRETMKDIFRKAAKHCKEKSAGYPKGERFQHFKACMKQKVHELYEEKAGLEAKA